MQPALDALLSGTARNPVRHALGLDALDQRLRPALPPALAAHARLANFTEGRLVFLVDSPIWHARLRLVADELIAAARSLGLEVREVAIKAASQPFSPSPPGDTRPATSRSGPGRSPATEEAFLAALAALSSDAPGKGDGGGG